MEEYLNQTVWNRTFRPGWNHENKETDTEWSSKIEGDTLILSFQGSLSKLDWIQNFMLWKKPYKRMKKWFFIHTGFLKKWKSIQEAVFKIVVDSNVKKVLLYGFSQGAGIATVALEDVAFNFPELDVKGIVYGSPRVISLFGSKEFNSRIDLVRVEYGNDIVTKIPPCWLFFKHVGKRFRFGEKRRWWKFSIKQHCESAYKNDI